MGIAAAFHRFESWIKGWPNGVLTVVLLFAAAMLVVIALRGSPLEKAIAATYVLFP